MKTIKKRQGQKGDKYCKNAKKGQKDRNVGRKGQKNTEKKWDMREKKTNRTKDTGKRKM